ncbi:Isochorismatase domain-containing protein 1 [Holothuria leucospilota]|uniref:Isochorismatase domain-containing protein 1 n=1 Tax=Holothuria leucospilota TaxID=206669 RepID=A0A9Q1H8K7_HOLLE|nr:Isochorismatase domain-containing protein 1 [Holothuria leucospilota]
MSSRLHVSPGNLSPACTAFLLCDMQEKFRPVIKHFPDILEVADRLVKTSKILQIPLIVTEQYPKGLGSTVEELDTSHAKGVYAKTKFSMVISPVEEQLGRLPNLTAVVLFGVETHVCVEQTAIDLVTRGLDVHVVADATSSRSMMDRMFAFERLRQAGVIVTTSEAVMFQLVGDKENPKFKEVQALVKNLAPTSGLCSEL